MALDIAMGGSTNTVLHILAIAHEAGVDFTMADIDRLSRKVPNICKVAPSSHYHVEDVHRAGGIFTILGELDRAGPHPPRRRARCTRRRWARPSTRNDIRRPTRHRRGASSARWPRRAACRRKVAFSQDKYFADADADVEQGLHPRRRARLQQGRRPGRALRQHRRGRLHREDRGRRRVDLEVRGAGARLPLAGGGVRRDHGRPDRRRRRRRHRLRGPEGRPRHAGDALPDVVPEGQGPRQGLRARSPTAASAGGTSGLSIGHVSPEAGEGGAIGLVEEGDRIRIDIPEPPHRRAWSTTRRSPSAARRWRRAARDAWRPNRDRTVSTALCRPTRS